MSLVAFVLLLLGTIDAAQFFYLAHMLEARVQSAARVGATGRAADEEIRNLVLHGTTRPPAGANPGLFLEARHVRITREGLGTDAARLTVAVVHYDYPFITPGLAGLRGARVVRQSVPIEPLP